MEKVFCIYCKHRHDWGDYGHHYVCYATSNIQPVNSYNETTPKRIGVIKCKKRNAKNDCEYFERKDSVGLFFDKIFRKVGID